MWLLPVLLLCTVSVAVFVLVVKLKRRRAQFSHIPGPPLCSFIAGHYPLIKRRTDQDGHMFDLYLEWTRKYGLTWCRWLFWKPGVIVLDGDSIKDMLVTNGGLPKLVNGAMTYFDGVRLTGYGGLLATLGGDIWMRKRRAMDPAFHKTYLYGMIPQMNKVTDRLLAKLDLLQGQSVDMKDYMQRAAMELISNVGFGVEMSSFEGDTCSAVNMVQHLFEGMYWSQFDPTFMAQDRILGSSLSRKRRKVQHPQYNPLWKKMRERAKQTIAPLRQIGHQSLEKRCEEVRRGEECPTDLLAHSLNIQANNTWYTNDDIVDDFITFFIAGQETTANVLAFTLGHVSRHGEVYQRIVDELDSVMREGECVGTETLSKLVYLEAVIKESMRLHPVAAMIRRMTNRESVIGGTVIPSQSMVLTLPYVLARMCEHWEDPLQFNPARFLHGDPQLIDRYVYMPFLVGPRKCIGDKFAMIEMKIILSKVFHRFRVRPVLGEGIRPHLKMTLYPNQGANIVFSRRDVH